jgi:hypothetical protein
LAPTYSTADRSSNVQAEFDVAPGCPNGLAVPVTIKEQEFEFLLDTVFDPT